jgi:hypothetical protein
LAQRAFSVAELDRRLQKLAEDAGNPSLDAQRGLKKGQEQMRALHFRMGRVPPRGELRFIK